MSRNLVYVNGQNESITFETGPYLIVKIEGLGIPNVDRQEQKAPYQDGTTYIDSLLQNRDIVVELAITKPNDFPNIALYRRELSQRLCPKYGLGTLSYTDEDGNSYNIRAVVSSMVFPNKDYRDPYMRAMVTFTACDPYWKDVTTDSISLPTSVTSAETVINAAATEAPCVIELANGDLFIAYKRVADGYLVSRTYTSSWSTESIINAAGSSYPSLIEKSNGNLVVAYSRASDNYLVSKTYTTSWSAESVISSAASFYPSLIERADGSLMVSYRRQGSDGYLVSRNYISSWSAETVITAASVYTSSLIERIDGSLCITYDRASGDYLCVKYYTSSWSAEEVITSSAIYTPSLIERSDGSLLVVYIRRSDSYLCYKTYSTSWGSESVLVNNTSSYCSVIERTNNSMFAAYTRTADNYLSSVTRSVAPVPAVITGDVPAPFIVTFNGPSVNPRIINQNTLEYIRLNTTLAAADHFDVDTTFGNKTVILTQGGIVKNGIAFLDIGSTFFQLARPTLPSLPVGVNPYRGLKAYWNMDSVPEIPDDPAGVTYRSDFSAGIDSFAATGATLAFASSELVATATATTVKLSRTVTSATLRTVRIKYKSPRTGTVSIYGTVGGVADTLIESFTYATANEYQLFDAYVAGALTVVYTTQSGITVSDIIYLNAVYIGTGAYLPNSLIDNFGNGKHGTIYGATPVEGISGKALAFDGVNDYVTIPNFAMSDIFTFSALVNMPRSSSRIINMGANATPQISLFREAANDILWIRGYSGSTVVDRNINDYFLNYNSVDVLVGIIIDWSTKAISIYRNGLLFSTTVLTGADKPTTGTLYIGAFQGVSGYFSGTIDEPRPYNRALSAEEVLYLYNNPDVAIPADATVVYYEDDAVLSTATATMEWTERYVGL